VGNTWEYQNRIASLEGSFLAFRVFKETFSAREKHEGGPIKNPEFACLIDAMPKKVQSTQQDRADFRLNW
jgi:hypothetical protein